MSSLEILSPEQRIQQLESHLLSVLTQLADLTSQLQSTQQRVADLEELELVSGQVYEADMEELQGRLNVHDKLQGLDDLDEGPDEQQNDDSD
jgi:hypothetical protein